jgi:hypothetical protein
MMAGACEANVGVDRAGVEGGCNDGFGAAAGNTGVGFGAKMAAGGAATGAGGNSTGFGATVAISKSAGACAVGTGAGVVAKGALESGVEGERDADSSGRTPVGTGRLVMPDIRVTLGGGDATVLGAVGRIKSGKRAGSTGPRRSPTRRLSGASPKVDFTVAVVVAGTVAGNGAAAGGSTRGLERKAGVLLARAISSLPGRRLVSRDDLIRLVSGAVAISGAGGDSASDAPASIGRNGSFVLTAA